MDVNVINSVLGAFTEVLPQLGFQSVDKQGLELCDCNVKNDGVIINISVTGPLKGCILIGMKEEAAKQFASKMMMGMPVTELDTLAQSAISEMGNMVCARSCINLSQAGVEGLDISPPLLLLGAGGMVKLAIAKIIMVKLMVDGIAVNVYIGLTA